MRGNRRILKYMGIFSGMQIVNILCSVARAKLIALFIGPAGMGLLAILNSAVEMVSNTTQLNLRQSAVRDVSDARESALPSIASAVRWWAKNLGILGALIIALGSPALSIISFGNMGNWWMFAALALAVFALSIIAGEQAILQGLSSLKALAKSSAYGAIAGTAISAPLYWLLGEQSIIPSIIIISLCSLFAVRWQSRAKGEESPWKSNFNLGKGFMKMGIAISAASLCVSLGNYAFLSFLNHMSGAAATGCYQAGYSMAVRYAGLVLTALAMEYYPRLARLGSRPTMTSKAVSQQAAISLCVLVPLIIIFVSADKLLVRLLYSEEFYAALPYAIICIGASALQAVSHSHSYVMLARGDSKAFVITDAASAAIGLALNVWLYSLWGMAGLGLAAVIWQAIYLGIVSAVCAKRYGVIMSRRARWISIASFAIILAAILLKGASWWAPLVMLLPSAALARFTLRAGRNL